MKEKRTISIEKYLEMQKEFFMSFDRRPMPGVTLNEVTTIYLTRAKEMADEVLLINEIEVED